MARVVAIMLIAVLTYAAMIGSFQPWDLALATLIAGATVFGFRSHLLRGASPSAPVLLRRLVFVPPLIGYMLWDIARGTWQVARYSLRTRPLEHPGIVAIPMGERTRFGATMSGFLTTVSPGTFLVDFDWTGRVILIHAIDATDPDAVRATHQAFYDRFQRHVFP
jgi:multisubunit Na+/H+ antiporter MnhE subunit